MLERHVAVQLRQHLDNNDLLDIFQSAYRQHHSTETALVRIQNDHLDRKKDVVTVLLDMSAAFDTVDHSVLIGQMRSIGIEGTAGIVYIKPDSHSAHWQSQLAQNADRIRHPTRICVGPNPLLHLYAAIGAIFRKHQLQYHLYADDAQLYVDLGGVRDGETADAVCRVERCIEEARLWMSDNNLPLNESKTEAMLMNADVTLCHHRPSETSGL